MGKGSMGRVSRRRFVVAWSRVLVMKYLAIMLLEACEGFSY